MYNISASESSVCTTELTGHPAGLPAEIAQKVTKCHMKMTNGTQLRINRIQMLYHVRYLKLNTYF